MNASRLKMIEPSLKTRLLLGLGSLLLVFLAFVVVKPSAAQEGTSSVTDDEVNAIAKELYCPVCESTPLDVCATQACADWREVIRTKLAEGQSEEEIKAYFELQYGPRALAEPPLRGVTLPVWIVPIIVVLVGAFAFSLYVRGLRTANRVKVAAEPPVQAIHESDQAPEPDDYRARLERELKEM